MAPNVSYHRVSVKAANKFEETQTLMSLYKAIPEGSYLAGLFTQDLVEWAEAQLNADVMPDIYEAYMSQLSNAARATSEAAQLRRELDRANTKIAALEGEIRTAESKTAYAETVASEAYDQLNAVTEELAEARREISQLEAARGELSIASVALDNNRVELEVTEAAFETVKAALTKQVEAAKLITQWWIEADNARTAAEARVAELEAELASR